MLPLLLGLCLPASDPPRLPPDCPIVYDNDWLRDVTDDEYLFALAHLGRARLVGLVLTRDEWDRGRKYTVADGLKDFNEDVALARRAGLKHIPDPVVGADRLLTRPPGGRPEDTEPIRSAGTDLIVREAREATPEKPLLVVVGGPLTTVASALATDPAIADRMVVLMTDIGGYNGTDAWGNYLVATRARLINFGADRLWWPDRPAPPVMPLERVDALPDSELTREVRRVAGEFWARSNRTGPGHVRDDGFGDGAGTFLIFAPHTWKAVRKVRVTGAWTTADAPDDADGPGLFLDAADCDFRAMRDEFFRTIADALRSAAADRPPSTKGNPR